MTVCQIYADMVVKAANEWDGQSNQTLYRLIADALCITPTQMWMELSEIIEERADYACATARIRHSELVMTRQRLTPQLPVAADMAPATTNQ
jgi:hypothetical protein